MTAAGLRRCSPATASGARSCGRCRRCRPRLGDRPLPRGDAPPSLAPLSRLRRHAVRVRLPGVEPCRECALVPARDAPPDAHRQSRRLHAGWASRRLPPQLRSRLPTALIATAAAAPAPPAAAARATLARGRSAAPPPACARPRCAVSAIAAPRLGSGLCLLGGARLPRSARLVAARLVGAARAVTLVAAAVMPRPRFVARASRRAVVAREPRVGDPAAARVRARRRERRARRRRDAARGACAVG